MAHRPRSIVAMIHVTDIERSIAYYEKLGFGVDHEFIPPGQTQRVWVWMASGRADVMLTKADGPIAADQQAILFYVYYDDVDAAKATLTEAGIETGPMKYPFYSPKGEFRLTDPDGYVLIASHS